MIKFYIARDEDKSLWLFSGEKPPIKGESPFTDDKRYIAFSPSLEPPISLEKDHPAGKNVTFEGGPVEVILSTMAEFEKLKNCQNCRGEKECHCDECMEMSEWRPES